MYIDVPSADFLQGDVLKGVKVREFIEFRTEQREGLHPEDLSMVRWKERSMTVAIVSHSCDVTMKNGGKRERVVVTPLRSADPGIVARICQTLKATGPAALNTAPTPGSTHFLNLFHYASNPALSDGDSLVDFTVLLSVRRDDISIEMKVLQLTEDQRRVYREKVGFLYGRGEQAPAGPPAIEGVRPTVTDPAGLGKDPGGSPEGPNKIPSGDGILPPEPASTVR